MQNLRPMIPKRFASKLRRVYAVVEARDRIYGNTSTPAARAAFARS